MNKLLLSALLASSLFGAGLQAIETKNQKIEQIFELTHSKQMAPLCESVFTNANITDASVKNAAMTKVMSAIKQDYVTAMGKLFSELDVDVMLKYNGSATGQRVTSMMMEVNTEMQEAWSSFMTIIEELAASPEKANTVVKSTSANNGTAKEQKIAQLFELTQDKQMLIAGFEPFFAGANITDAKVKNAAIDRLFITLKPAYIKAHNKFFSEAEINAMLNYHSSATGKRYIATTMDIAAAMQKSFMDSLMPILEASAQTAPTPAPVEDVVKSAAVIHFDAATKDKKTDDEIRALFNKEIGHDGLTVVKFSSTWCPPCKAYAPIFDSVAEQLTQVVIDGKKVAVKYIAVDTDAAAALAQEYSIRSIPTTIFYKNGKKIDSRGGSIKGETLNSLIGKLARS